MAEHTCKQEKVIENLETRLSEGHDRFAAIQARLDSMMETIGEIKGKVGFINGRVTMWGALAGGIAGLVGSLIVGAALLYGKFKLGM